jgi:glycosyltransferase involved in cell wall biosynthesis
MSVEGASGPDPMISVVIPARNSEDVITGQLAAMSRQDHDGPWEVIVADNGSDDGTAAAAAGWADRIPGLRVVSAADGIGINHARNAGAREAGGDFLLFCDADDEADPGWVRAMAGAARTCTAVGGSIEKQSLNDRASVEWRPPLVMTELPIMGGFLPRPVGANCGVRADVWRDLGGFDEDYRVGATETEFFWRLQLAGHQVCFVPEAVIHYRFRSGLRAHARQSFKFGVARTRLYRDFRDQGMPRTSAGQVLRRLAWLVTHLPDLVRDGGARGRWVGQAASQWGRVIGSIRHRLVYL